MYLLNGIRAELMFFSSFLNQGAAKCQANTLEFRNSNNSNDDDDDDDNYNIEMMISRSS